MEILEEQLLKQEQQEVDMNNNQLHRQQRKDVHDESISGMGSTLQEDLLRIQHEKEMIAVQVIDLEERCKELEEELEERHDNSNEHLEEDLYELKLKLNKRQVEHQREMKELEERLTL